MSSPTLASLERAYFVRKTGGTVPSSRPLNQVKRDYMVSFLGGLDKNTKVDNVETLWLQKMLNDESIAPAPDTASMWKQIVAFLGLTPSRYINDNKRLFYVHAT